jgi:hypothetical protein
MTVPMNTEELAELEIAYSICKNVAKRVLYAYILLCFLLTFLMHMRTHNLPVGDYMETFVMNSAILAILFILCSWSFIIESQNLKKDIQSRIKLKYVSTVVKKHSKNGVFSLILETNEKLSIDEELYVELEEGDTIDIEHAPKSKMVFSIAKQSH